MKQHHVFLYILIALSLVLCLRYLGKKYINKIDTSEGFSQSADFVLKQNDDIYDAVYVEMYDELHQPEKRCNLEVNQIIQMTQPSIEYSCFLDLGSGTGSMVRELTRKGYRAFGIDKSSDMVSYSRKKDENIQIEQGDIIDPMIFESGTFTHIICNYFTIYSFKDKMPILKNCYQWITPGGYMILHLVDPNRFDTIVPVGKPLNIDSPQKYTNHRILETYVDLDKYHFKSVFDPKKYKIMETFTDNNSGKIRQNEQQLYMESKETILGMCNMVGFILQGQLNYQNITGNSFQYLIVLERPM